MRKNWALALLVPAFFSASVRMVTAQTPNFTMDRNVFQPSKDIVVTSVFTPILAGKTSYLLFNSAGELVKDFKSQDAVANLPQTFTWDGKNDKGEPVASGYYFFRFKVDLGTYVKKLIVIH